MSPETDRKLQKVAALARARGLAGVVLATRHNFAWFTAGMDNTVDASRETAAGSLLVTASARAFVLANTIEAPRLADATAGTVDATVVEFPWAAEKADASVPYARASAAAGGPVGADVLTRHAQYVEPDLARLRVTLDEDELPRYRTLASESAAILEAEMRSLRPGMPEIEVRRAIAAALFAHGVEPAVLLVGGDDRIARFRHPIATAAPWRERLLVALCGTRQGHVVALSRIVSVEPPAEFVSRTRATAGVFAAILDATVPSATGAAVFAAAAHAYAGYGFAGEEQRHHQGGAIAYRSREWVAHPESKEVVGGGQAFAWNPTITGTKVEDTCFVHADGRVEILTATAAWPAIELEVRGAVLRVADALVIG